MATEQDQQSSRRRTVQKEKEAFKICLEKIRKHGLEYEADRRRVHI